MVQELSIKHMIKCRQSRTRFIQGSSCSFHGGRFMDSSNSSSSSWSFLHVYKTFLTKYGHNPLFLSAFILITTCIFLDGSRRLCHILRRERHNIFGTIRVLIMMPCRLIGKYDSNKNKRVNVVYWLLYWVSMEKQNVLSPISFVTGYRVDYGKIVL